MRGKTRQIAENKHTFHFTGKTETEGKTRQNAENKQAFQFTGKTEINRKTRQNTETKQTLDLTGKIEFEGKKLVKTLKINMFDDLLRFHSLRLQKTFLDLAI